MQKHAKMTSKGQVTVPREVRRVLGLEAGDQVLFETDDDGVRIRPVRKKSGFAKYRGTAIGVFLPAGKASLAGLMTCGANDHRNRHQHHRCLVGQRPITQLYHAECVGSILCSGNL